MYNIHIDNHSKNKLFGCSPVACQEGNVEKIFCRHCGKVTSVGMFCSQHCEVESYYIAKTNVVRRGKKISTFLIVFFTSIFVAFAGVNVEAISMAHSINGIPGGVGAIIGEAEAECYAGKVALAEAIRNRLKEQKNFKGIYGLRAKKRIIKAPKYVKKQSHKAWEESKESNLTKGATVWGNEDDLKKFAGMAWFKHFSMTTKIGNHYFFAENKSGVKKSVGKKAHKSTKVRSKKSKKKVMGKTAKKKVVGKKIQKKRGTHESNSKTHG